MSQIKDEKMNDSSMNGPNAHHSGNANHKPKDEFHGGGRGGRGNRFQPYGGLNRDRKGPRDNSNNMVNILYYVYIMCGCRPIVTFRQREFFNVVMSCIDKCILTIIGYL